MMKRILTPVLIFLFFFSLSVPVKSQTVIAELNFDGYNGTVQTVPAGYYFSWNSTTSNSFYTSAGNFGASAPSYKFGNDGDFIITPNIGGGQLDSLSFWSRGNGSPFSPLNELRIYHSIDSINWILDATIVPLSASGVTTTVPLNQASGYFKIEYYKAPAGGNLAFDDLKIYSNVAIGISEVKKEEVITVYPTPTTGMLNIRMVNSISSTPTVEVFDILGNRVKGINVERKGKDLYAINLSGKSRGFYFVKIQSDSQFVTKRITLIN